MPTGNKAYKNSVKGITNGKPFHVPNKDGGAYGDYTKKSLDDGATGSGRKNVFRQMPIK
jgi:hypothetical protein